MFKTPILDGFPPVLIPVIFVAFFGVIVLVVILLKKKVKIFRNDEKPKSDKEIAAEELDRLLEPVEELEPVKEDDAEAPKEEAEEPKE